MLYENDKYQMSGKYMKLSTEELKEAINRAYDEMKTKQDIRPKMPLKKEIKFNFK